MIGRGDIRACLFGELVKRGERVLLVCVVRIEEGEIFPACQRDTPVARRAHTGVFLMHNAYTRLRRRKFIEQLRRRVA